MIRVYSQNSRKNNNLYFLKEFNKKERKLTQKTRKIQIDFHFPICHLCLWPIYLEQQLFTRKDTATSLHKVKATPYNDIKSAKTSKELSKRNSYSSKRKYSSKTK